ncbi:MAG: hypothetical protein Q9227_000121 [Pyrenula ochraceoflavens]
MDPLGDVADVEKSGPILPDSEDRRDESDHRSILVSNNGGFQSALGSKASKFEKTLIKYNLEARGIQRVEEHEKFHVGWLSYLQIFLLWFSINLAANNITLGMLGPAVYELSFRDASLCAVFGSLLGSVPVAWIATWGPKTGLRTLVSYSMIDCVVGGQILSAVSPNGSLSVVVGIIIVALITWLVTTFGISVFHRYERYAFLPQLIILSILYGVASPHFDLSTPSAGSASTVAGSRLSFFSLCFAAAITYGGAPADFFVYYSTNTNPYLLSGLTLASLTFSFTFALILGIGLASGLPTYPPYNTAYTSSQGGSAAGALLVSGLSPLHTFGKFCAVCVALGLIANTIPPTYSSGVDFQILGRYAERVPRFIWNTAGVVIYTVCALAGRNSLAAIFTNFLALMGYWVAIWVAIILVEFVIFRRHSSANYDWSAWNEREKLPLGIAALVAFLVGWVGAILCMAQVWYTGPIAGLVGEEGGDMGNYVGFGVATVAYGVGRWVERRLTGR